MTEDERRLLEDLFDRLAEAERQAPYRDRDAERLVSDRLARQPAAAYYLVQAALVQEHALREAKLRIDDLEAQVRQSESGQRGSQPSSFLGGLFGGGASSRVPNVPPSGPYGRPSYQASQLPPDDAARSEAFRQAAMRGGGGGFLAGAAQTAIGVAGGVVAGSLIADMLRGDDKPAAGGDNGAQQTAGDDQAGQDEEIVSGGFDSDDFGSDFG